MICGALNSHLKFCKSNTLVISRLALGAWYNTCLRSAVYLRFSRVLCRLPGRRAPRRAHRAHHHRARRRRWYSSDVLPPATRGETNVFQHRAPFCPHNLARSTSRGRSPAVTAARRSAVASLQRARLLRVIASCEAPSNTMSSQVDAADDADTVDTRGHDHATAPATHSGGAWNRADKMCFGGK